MSAPLLTDGTVVFYTLQVDKKKHLCILDRRWPAVGPISHVHVVNSSPKEEILVALQDGKVVILGLWEGRFFFIDDALQAASEAGGGSRTRSGAGGHARASPPPKISDLAVMHQPERILLFLTTAGGAGDLLI